MVWIIFPRLIDQKVTTFTSTVKETGEMECPNIFVRDSIKFSTLPEGIKELRALLSDLHYCKGQKDMCYSSQCLDSRSALVLLRIKYIHLIDCGTRPSIIFYVVLSLFSVLSSSAKFRCKFVES